MQFNLPRHDPRLEQMTPEEYEFEYLTWERFTGRDKNAPSPEELNAIQKRLEEIVAREEAQRKAEATEPVNPDEVF